MTRTTRPSPRDLTTGWPDQPSPDAAGEVARTLAVRLQNALGELGMSVRALERASGVDEATIRKLLAGTSWPDLRTIARIEIALDREIYMSPVS